MAKKLAAVVAVEPQDEAVKLKAMNRRLMDLTIEGISPLVQHAWDQKAITMMAEKHAGKKTRNRDVRNPEAEALAATYFTPEGKYAIPLLALKSAIITAAHKDIGVEKTLVKKAFFIVSPNPEMMLLMKCSEPVTRQDHVRVGMGSTDLRYRPQFSEWSVQFTVEFDADLLQPTDIVNLIERAGFGVGIGEYRPEKGGEWGRFRVRAT